MFRHIGAVSAAMRTSKKKAGAAKSAQAPAKAVADAAQGKPKAKP